MEIKEIVFKFQSKNGFGEEFTAH